MFRDRKEITDGVGSGIAGTAGRSCLIDDDEEKEALRAENNWAQNDSLNSNGSNLSKTGEHVFDGANKKKHKKKWIQLPLDDVGLSYPNPRLVQQEQRSQRNSPSSCSSYQIFNAWKGKKGSDLFVKKTVDEKFVGKQTSRGPDVNGVCGTSVNGDQHKLSEEELLVMEALKESIKTHKKEEEKRHKALLIEIASLSEDEKVGGDETEYESENGLRKYPTEFSDKTKKHSDHNNNNNDIHAQFSRKNKSLQMKSVNSNSRNYQPLRFLGDEQIKFNSYDEENDCEKSTRGPFRVNTMTFNNSNNRNYNNSKNVDNRSDSHGRSKSGCAKIQNQKEESIQYIKGILKNDSRKSATSTCAGIKNSSEPMNSSSEENNHIQTVNSGVVDTRININRVESSLGGYQSSKIARSPGGSEKCMAAPRSSFQFVSSAQVVNSEVLIEKSSELQNEQNKLSPGTISLCTQTEDFSVPNRSTGFGNVNTVPVERQERPENTGSVVTNPGSSFRSVPLSPYPVNPVACNDFVSSIWQPVSPSVVNDNNLITQVNGCDSSCRKVPQIVHDGLNRVSCQSTTLNQENVNPLVADNRNDSSCKNLSEVQDENQVTFRNASSDLFKMKESELKDNVIFEQLKTDSVNLSVNSSDSVENLFCQPGNYANVQAPPGFVANLRMMQQNAARPALSIPPSQEIHSPIVQQLSTIEPRPSPFVPNNVGLSNQNFNEMKEYVEQIISRFPEIKDFIFAPVPCDSNNIITHPQIQATRPTVRQIPHLVVQDRENRQPQLVHQVHVPHHQIFPTQHSSQPCLVPLPIQNPLIHYQNSQSLNNIGQFHSQLPSQQMSAPLENLMPPSVQTAEIQVTSLQNHNQPHIPLESLSRPSEVPFQQVSLPQFLQPQLSQSKTNLPQSVQQMLPHTGLPVPQHTLPHTISTISQQTMCAVPQEILSQPLQRTQSSVSQIDFLQSQTQFTEASQVKSQQNIPQQLLSYPFLCPPQYLPVSGLQCGQVVHQNVSESTYQQHQILNVNREEGSVLDVKLAADLSQCNATVKSLSLEDNDVNSNSNVIDENSSMLQLDSEVVRNLEKNSTCQFLQTSFIDHPESRDRENNTTLPGRQSHEQHQLNSTLPVPIENDPRRQNGQMQATNDFDQRFIPGQTSGGMQMHLMQQQQQQQQQHQLHISLLQSNFLRLEPRGRGRLYY